MDRKIAIKSCTECSYKDHSGSFTTGGAYPLCRNADHPPGMAKPSNYAGTSRVLPCEPGTRFYDGTIPDWCPLPMDVPAALPETPGAVSPRRTDAALHDDLRSVIQRHASATGVLVKHMDLDWKTTMGGGLRTQYSIINMRLNTEFGR